MKKIFFIILFLIPTINFSYSQIEPFFNFKKIEDGILIGVELIDKKSKNILNTKDFYFEWQFPSLSFEIKKTYSNLFILKTAKNQNIIDINLTVRKDWKKPLYQFKTTIEIPQPEIVFVKKDNGIIMPLSKLKENDYLTIKTKNFSSNNLKYSWSLDNAFLTREKEIYIKDLPKNENSIIKVKVSAANGETVIDSAYIQIE